MKTPAVLKRKQPGRPDQGAANVFLPFPHCIVFPESQKLALFFCLNPEVTP